MSTRLRHSLRIDPISLSAYSFLRGIHWCNYDFPYTHIPHTLPEIFSIYELRSRIKYFGTVSQRKASTICWAVHRIVWCLVALKWITLRRLFFENNNDKQYAKGNSNCEKINRNGSEPVETPMPVIVNDFAFWV